MTQSLSPFRGKYTLFAYPFVQRSVSDGKRKMSFKKGQDKKGEKYNFRVKGRRRRLWFLRIIISMDGGLFYARLG